MSKSSLYFVEINTWRMYQSEQRNDCAASKRPPITQSELGEPTGGSSKLESLEDTVDKTFGPL